MTRSNDSASSSGVVAAFDFDKTLSTRDCVVPFIGRVLTSRRTLESLGDLPRALRAGVRRDRDSLKEIVTRRAFSGVNQSTIEETARAFALHVRKKWMRTDTLERLQWHKDQGHRTGLVSASYGVYLRPIGEEFGLDFVIATELEFDPQQMATGRLLEGNCRGPQKALRLKRWMKEHGLEDSIVYAYGDSSGDRELLEMAHHPQLIGKVTKWQS